MKIIEVQNLYRPQLAAYREQKLVLANQRKELDAKIKANPADKHIYENEAAILELSYNAVSEKYDEYRTFMDKVNEMHTCYWNLESSKQQCDAMEEYAEDLGKILEVARRISSGATVPPKDEQMLMEYSMEMYMAAKNMAVMNQQENKEEYDSLWNEDEEQTTPTDPREVADNTQINISMPKIVNPGDVIASATASTQPTNIDI